MSYVASIHRSISNDIYRTNPGCLAPLRHELRECVSSGDTPLAMNYGHSYSPIHPKCTPAGAEIIDFMMDFFPNFTRNFPWMNAQRLSMLTGSNRALFPEGVDLNDLMSRDMHVAVMFPRWLAEGSRPGMIGNSLSLPVPWTWVNYNKFRAEGFNPLVSFVMSYIHNSRDLTETSGFGDQTPFNHCNVNTTNGFKKYLKRMISLNSPTDVGVPYIEEHFRYWDQIETTVPSGITCPWETPHSIDDVFTNATTLDNAFTQWRAQA